MKKESFLMPKSLFRHISGFSDEKLGRLFRAIYWYQLTGDTSVDEDIEIAFFLFKNRFDKESD